MLPAPPVGPATTRPRQSWRSRATVQHYKELAELVAGWGGKTLIYLPGWIIYGTSRRQAWAWSREVLAEVADAIEHTGVTLVIEPTTHDTNLCVNADDAIELMQDINRENVKLMFDTFHVLYNKEVMTDYVYKMGADLKHIHISDNDRLPPGRGVGDFPALVDALDIDFGVPHDGDGFHQRRKPDKTPVLRSNTCVIG